MTIRRGLGKGTGSGYRNIVGKDPYVHSASARGVKQPQIKNIPPVMMKPTVRKNNFEAPIRNPYFENWSDEQLMREWRRTPRGLSQYGSDRYQALLREIVERKKRKDAEKVVGGLGDNRPDSDFDKKELTKGIKVEMEHTKDPKVAKEIVKDHLSEFPKGYYEELDKMEKKLKKQQPANFRFGGRYTLRKINMSWSIYDRETNSIAKNSPYILSPAFTKASKVLMQYKKEHGDSP